MQRVIQIIRSLIPLSATILWAEPRPIRIFASIWARASVFIRSKSKNDTLYIRKSIRKKISSLLMFLMLSKEDCLRELPVPNVKKSKEDGSDLCVFAPLRENKA